jgi:biopolymer transport protein ExbB
MRHAIPRSHRWLNAAFVAWLACMAAATPVVAQPPAADGAEPGVVPELADEDAPFSLSTMVIDLFSALGVWTVPFAAVTLVALWVTADRLVVLRRGRVIPKPFVQRFLKLLDEGELEPGEALQICEENDSPVAHVFAHGIRKWGKPSVEVEQAIIDGGERQVSALRNHLRILNGVTTVAPLLGLLGTVWGMLLAFKDIAKPGQGHMEQLGADIALALVTTAAGLVIAIPAVCVYLFLSGRVDSLVMEMDDLSQRVVHCISAEALTERASRPRRVAKVEKPATDEAPTAKKRAV